MDKLQQLRKSLEEANVLQDIRESECGLFCDCVYCESARDIVNIAYRDYRIFCKENGIDV